MAEGSEPQYGSRPEQAEQNAGAATHEPVRVLGGPANGFGRMWQKTYTMNVGTGVSPRAVMATWRKYLPGLWPQGHGSGVSVLYADAESFTAATGRRDAVAAWITLSAQRAGADTIVRVHILMRAQDPLCELALALGGYRKEDRFWVATMSALAARLGVPAPAVETRSICLDARHKWPNTRNVCHSPVLRGVGKAAGSPFSVVRLSVAGLRPRLRV